tara:strand:+ start:10411 stop:11325 length:915 start_codon:yes stop_codon:yes gene_type:complete
MTVGDIISAFRYNELQGKINALLGIGSGDKGYNQTVSSSAIAVSDTVQVVDMNNLHTDFTKVYVHINNTTPPTISTVTTSNEITDSLHNAYEILIQELEDDRFLLSSAQADIESGGVNSIRNGAAQPWGGTSLPQSINHTVRLTFTSPNARRGFFNAGGQIRFDASLNISSVPSDTNLAKNQDWETMLSNSGQIQFGRTVTTNTLPSGTAYAIGNEDLTTTYQNIYLKTGAPGGTYSDNQWYIEAKEVDNSTIDFNIVFDDVDVGDGGADEYVAGVLTSSVSHIRASGSYVNTPAPSYAKTSDL